SACMAEAGCATANTMDKKPNIKTNCFIFLPYRVNCVKCLYPMDFKMHRDGKGTSAANKEAT
ncbi:hypothetical protein LWT55_23265, partial [Enterobacter hormaechei]|nr:hypothetical protein [Enterobacter hormaechei]